MEINDEIKKIMEKLAEPLSEKGIQRTNKAQTKKGYDTIGYKSQFVVNRFNEVLGINWGFEYKILKETEGKYGSGSNKIDIVIEMSLWIIEPKPEYTRIGIGGHTSFTYVDALKGAVNNALKRTGAYFGVGRQAWEETIDEDDDPTKCAFEDDKQQHDSKLNKSQQTSKPLQDAQQKDHQQNHQKTEQQGDKNNGNKNEKILSSKIIWTKFSNLKYPNEYKDLYKFYYLDKFKGVISMNELSQDQLKILDLILTNAIKDKDYREQFRKHLDGFKPKQSQSTIHDKGITIESLYSMLAMILDFPQNCTGKWESWVCHRYGLAAPWEMSTDEMIEQKDFIERAINSKQNAEAFMKLLMNYEEMGKQYPEYSPEQTASEQPAAVN